MGKLAVPIGLILFCGLAYWQTTQFDRVPPILLRGMQPADFPQLVLMLIAGLSVILIVQALRGAAAATESDAPIDQTTAGEQTDRMSANVLKTMSLFLVFAALAPIDLFLGLGAFAVGLAILWGERRALLLLLVGVVTPVFVFLLFDQVFEVRFPRGLLTNLWYG